MTVLRISNCIYVRNDFPMPRHSGSLSNSMKYNIVCIENIYEYKTSNLLIILG